MQKSVSVRIKEAIDSFKEDFDNLDEIQKTVDDISSISALEDIASPLTDLLTALQDLDSDITVRIEELNPDSDDYPDDEEEDSDFPVEE